MKRDISKGLNIVAAHLLFFIYCIMLQPSPAGAQTFTEYLTRIRAGEATVSLHQDEEIDALVNGLVSYAPGRTTAPKRTVRSLAALAADTVAVADSSAWTDLPLLTGRRVRMNGYRIQIYAGGDNRKSKAEAYAAAAAIRNYFDDVTVYTNFISPRWVCRIGDFKTREEAAQMLSSIRQTGAFREAFIVKTKIIALY